MKAQLVQVSVAMGTLLEGYFKLPAFIASDDEWVAFDIYYVLLPLME